MKDFVRTVVSEEPRIRTVRNLISTAVCAELIEAARGHLGPARRLGHDGRPRLDPGRSNTACFIPNSPLVEGVQARIAAATGLSVRGMEPAQILRYEPGQYFAPHHDYFDLSAPGHDPRKGQRILTALIYLSDDFEGGETDFPLLNIRLRVPTGDAIYFANTVKGAPDRRTLHAGLPPTRGEKWALSQWVRDRIIQ